MTSEHQPHEHDKPDDSFSDELRTLLQGLGWGFRWLGLSLAWGCTLFGAMAMLIYAIVGGEVTNPPAFYGLIVVLGLMAAILTVWRRRY
ncbi:MAG: hypothetical protein AAF629_27140 [Chloroflexota bacterium]